jgi:hypothetical protein
MYLPFTALLAHLSHLQVLSQFCGANLMGQSTRTLSDMVQAGVPLSNIVITLQKLNEAGLVVVSVRVQCSVPSNEVCPKL